MGNNGMILQKLRMGLAKARTTNGAIACSNPLTRLMEKKSSPALPLLHLASSYTYRLLVS
jgi:hypothetical protein